MSQLDSRSIAERKASLRRAARLTRDAISHEVALEWSEQVMARLTRFPAFVRARSVFTYVSVKNEVRTRDLIEKLWNRDVQVLVPTQTDSGELGMLPATDWADVQVDSSGWCRPVKSVNLSTAEPDVNLVPGLLFSQSGHRIGSGLGQYDRFIAQHPHALHIGLAYELQLKDDLPTEPHDQVLDFVVTQDRLIRISTKKDD